MAMIKFVPTESHLVVGEGTTLLSAARAAGITETRCCGMKPICGACRVSVIEGERALNGMGELEKAFCKERGFLPYQRLGCLAKVKGDAEIWVEWKK